MIKLGRVSEKTKGIEEPLKVEDKATCAEGNLFLRPVSGCPAG